MNTKYKVLREIKNYSGETIYKKNDIIGDEMLDVQRIFGLRLFMLANGFLQEIQEPKYKVGDWVRLKNGEVRVLKRIGTLSTIDNEIDIFIIPIEEIKCKVRPVKLWQSSSSLKRRNVAAKPTTSGRLISIS